MDVFLMILCIIAGVVMLIIGADMFVDGASGIAGKLRVSAFVIGMTIVAFGTSAPELAVSFKSVISGSGDIAMGNVVGSNIINILLILGISSLIRNLGVEKKTAMLEIPFLCVVTAVLFLLAEIITPMEVSHIEGLIFVLLFGAYIAYMVVGAVKQRKKEKLLASPDDGVPHTEISEAEKAEPPRIKRGILGAYDRMQDKVWFLIVITLVGLAFVVLGADLVVNNVEKLTELIPNDNARKILSVTVVALGTSLPELVTSVVAAVKGNTDLALGNIIGSNIMNILLILGLPALIFGIPYPSSFFVDILVSLGAGALLLVCVGIGKGKRINKVGGALMLVGLVGYLVYLFLS